MKTEAARDTNPTQTPVCDVTAREGLTHRNWGYGHVNTLSLAKHWDMS